MSLIVGNKRASVVAKWVRAVLTATRGRLRLLMFLAASSLMSVVQPAAADNAHWLTGYFAYYYNNDTTYGMKVDQFDYSKLTHAIFWPVVPKTDGTLDTDSILGAGPPNFNTLATDFVTRAHAAGTQALLGIGGDFGSNATAGFRASTDTPQERTAFIANIMALVTQYGFDGVDINWEVILPADDANVVAFMQGLRTQLNTVVANNGQPGYLTFAPETPRNRKFGDTAHPNFAQLINQLVPYVDQINVQTYIMSGPFPGFETWFNSPLKPGANFASSGATPPSIEEALKNLTDAGVPRGKLAFGIQTALAVWQGNRILPATPAEGAKAPRQELNFNVDQPGIHIDQKTTDGGTAVASRYRDLATTYKNYSVPQIDPDAMQSWIARKNNPGSYPNDQFINFDSPASLAMKGDALASPLAGVGGDLGGAFIFELSGDFTPSAAALEDRNPLLKAANKMKMLLPMQVTVPKATAGDKSVTLSWVAAPGAGYYRVYKSSGGTRGTLVVDNVKLTQYKVSNLVNGTKYGYVIVPVNRFGEGVQTAEVSATPVAQTVAAPIFTPGSSSATKALSVTLSVPNSTAEIYYTQSSDSVPPPAPTATNGPGVLKYSEAIRVYDQHSYTASALRDDGTFGPAAKATYNVQLAKTAVPTFKYPDGTTFNDTITVTIKAPGQDLFPPDPRFVAAVYYTIGSVMPVCTHTSGTTAITCNPEALRYRGSFDRRARAGGTVVINAIAIDPNLASSVPVTVKYLATATTKPPKPTLTPGGDGVNFQYQSLGSPLSVTIDDLLANSNIFYTLGAGTATPPDPTSTASASNFAIAHGGTITISASTKVKVRAFNTSTGITAPSDVSLATYTVLPNAATPVANPASGHDTVPNAPTVKLTSATPSARIYYTLDGSAPKVPTQNPLAAPTLPTMLYPAAGIKVAKSEFIRSVAISDNTSISGTTTPGGRYVLVPVKPTFDKPATVSYPLPDGVTVTIGSATPNVNFFYTTDGTAPASSGTPKATGSSAAVVLKTTTRLRAITSRLPDLEDSDEISALYKVPLQAVWIPDFYAQNVNVRTGTGANLKSVALNTTPANCSPNSVAVSKDAYLYVACIPINGADDKILVYDALTIKNAARPVAENAKLDLTPLKTIKANPNGVSFSGLIGLAFDSEQNLWTTSYDNSRVFSVSAAALLTDAPLAQARLQNTPPSPAGLAFDTDGSLWVVSNDGRLFNLEKAKLQGNDADINPSYYIGFDSNPAPPVPFKKPEGVAIYGTANGKSKVWVSNNGSFEQGKTMVWFTKGVAGTGGGVGTIVQGSPTVTGSGQNILRCPGGLFATPKRLWLNDQGFGKPTTVCGAADNDRATGVGAVINFTSAQLGAAAASQIAEPQILRNITSRPGFGGIFIEDEE